MEIFRQLGMEQAVRDVAIPHTRNVTYAPSLAGAEITRRPMEKVIPEAIGDWSPTWGCTFTQDVVDPLLLAQARRHAPAQFGLTPNRRPWNSARIMSSQHSSIDRAVE
jgi:hypothetical protein